MITWISSNIGTIIVAAILIAIVVAIIRSTIKDRRSGKTSCGCGCANCAMAGQCHKANSDSD